MDSLVVKRARLGDVSQHSSADVCARAVLFKVRTNLKKATPSSFPRLGNYIHDEYTMKILEYYQTPRTKCLQM